MGDPKKPRKKYETPSHPYRMDRLQSELDLVGRYGLRNKREVWRAKSILGRWRAQARSMLALDEEERAIKERVLINKMARYGLLPESSTFEAVLSLEVEDVLKRRLQTLVYEKGLARTPHQARQMIVHRHIMVGDHIVTSPSYLVPTEEEDTIRYAPKSPFNREDHPMRPQATPKYSEEENEEEKEEVVEQEGE